jgi:hypothetical protein
VHAESLIYDLVTSDSPHRFAGLRIGSFGFEMEEMVLDPRIELGISEIVTLRKDV